MPTPSSPCVVVNSAAVGRSSGNNAPSADLRPVSHLRIWRTPHMISSKHKICRPPAAGRHAPGFIAKRGAVLSSVLLLVRDNGVVCGLEWRPSSEATRARLESPLLNLTGRLENGRSQRGGAGFF